MIHGCGIPAAVNGELFQRKVFHGIDGGTIIGHSDQRHAPADSGGIQARGLRGWIACAVEGDFRGHFQHVVA